VNECAMRVSWRTQDYAVARCAGLLGRWCPSHGSRTHRGLNAIARCADLLEWSLLTAHAEIEGFVNVFTRFESSSEYDLRDG
jgi:hypothetical protein